ncbi:MAG: VUT family protein [Trueperaceae bacterium]
MTNDRLLDPPGSRTRSDGARLFALPLGVLLGASGLLWMAGFGQEPPDVLPIAALAFFGALFGDALHDALRRSGRAVTPAVATGVALAVVAGLVVLPARDRIAPATALILALALLALPRRWGEMLGPMTVYTAATLLANYTFDAFLPVGDWFLVNMGTLFFGITFTQRDRVHRFGRRAVYVMIVAAAGMNVLAALSIDTPLRYVAVSFLAIVLAETADTEVYHRLLKRSWLVRVASSNGVSAPIDTIVFTVLAFYGAPWATAQWMLQVIVTDVFVKYGSSIVTGLLLLRSRAARTPEPMEAVTPLR